MNQISGTEIAAPEGYALATFKPPRLVSVSYTAVYDNGSVSTGAAVSDGSGEPMIVEFKNAVGRSIP